MTGHFRFRTRVMSFALSVIFCLLASPLFGALLSWRVDIRRLPETSGDVSYEADFSGVSRQVLHLPNGTTVTPAPFVDVTYESFDALRSAFVGNWTLEIQAFGTLFPHELYTFQISDFPESLLYTIPPNITSPINASVVPVNFTMAWEWPAGVAPPPVARRLTRRFGPDSSSRSSSEHGGIPDDSFCAK